MPKLLQFAAHAGHLALYGLMLAIPLSGWLMSSAKGFQTVWFGVLPIPDLLDKDKELGDLLQTVHMSLNLLFVVVIAGHIGAALKHHFIDKDDILTRMLPRIPRRTDMKRIALLAPRPERQPCRPCHRIQAGPGGQEQHRLRL
jgi:cytochrome b561